MKPIWDWRLPIGTANTYDITTYFIANTPRAPTTSIILCGIPLCFNYKDAFSAEYISYSYLS